jgi:ATP-dependent Lon protease
VRKFKGQYPVPTYVAEFLLGRYCASVEDEEISDGLKIVERQLGEKTIRAGEHELFKARAKDKGQVKLIDIITARLDAGTDSFLATLPSLQLKDVRIGEEMVHANERMFTGGFYAEVELAYDPTIAQEKNGRPFGIESLREIQLSKREVLPALYQGREAFATEEWKNFLIGVLAWNRNNSRPVPATWCSSEWFRSWSATTTWWSLVREAPARATCSSKSRRMPTLSQEVK